MNYSIFTFYNVAWNDPSYVAIPSYNIDSNYLNSYYTYHHPIQNIDQHLLNTNVNITNSQILRYQEINQNTPTLTTEETFKQKRKNTIKSISSSNTVKYGKKNAESNVVNQVFSFLSIRSKSKKILSAIVKNSQEMINTYYQVVRQLKKKNKKYINRYYLKQLISLPENHLATLLLKKIDACQKLGMDLFKKILRILIKYYFTNVSINAILTSSKLDKQTKYEHLQRKKEIEMYLKYHMRISDSTQLIQ